MERFQGGYSWEGILSSYRGCRAEPYSRISRRQSRQLVGARFIGENPGVFTEASCYLPWIADSYGLTLARGYATGCRPASGDKEDVGKDDCIAINQKKCRFDTGFTFLVSNAGVGDVDLGFNKTGAYWNQCILGNQGGLSARIVYECLAFDGNMFDNCCGSNNFAECDIVLNGDISSQEVVDASNRLYELCNIDIRDFISSCPNNCRGVRLDNIIAGGVAVFSTAVATTLGTTFPFLPFAGVGILGAAGGAMLASEMCRSWGTVP